MPAATVAPEPVAIQAAEIPQRADETFGRLREIGRELERRDEVTAIQEALPAVKTAVDNLQRDARTQPGATPSMRDIDDLQQRWAWVREQLTNWNATLTQRAIGLDAQIQELRRIEETWAATEASASEQGIPRVLRESVRSTRADVAQLTSDLRAWRGTILTLQGTLAELNGMAAERQVALDGEAERVRSQLLVSESEPIWSIVRVIRWENILRALANVQAESRADVVQFFRSASGRALIHLGILIALTLVGLRVRQRSQSWDLDDAALEMVAQLRDRPISAAMLASAFFSLWIYGQFPSAVRALFIIVSAVPLVRVLRVGIFAALPTAPVELAALAVLVSLAALFPTADPVTRLVFLGENIAIALWLGWITRPQRLVQIQTTAPWRRLIAFGARVGQGIALVAIIANIVGNVSLTELLTYGVFGCVFAAVALDATRQIANGLFVGALSARFIRSLNVVQRHAGPLRQRGMALITAGAVASWIYRALYSFSVLSPAMRGVQSALLAELHVGSLRVSLGDVLALAVTIWVSVTLSRIIATVLEEDVLPRLSLPRGVPGAISVTARYGVLMLGFFAALSAAGFEIGQLTVLLGAFGIGLSFGLQNIVNNFVSGLILILERPIQVGDVVEVEQITGEVRSIGFRSSLIRTFDGAEVIVPNGNMLSQRVTNWTLSDRKRRVELTVGVAYGTDPKQIIELLLGVARQHPDVLDHPPPSALFVGFGASSLDFSLRVWTLRQEPFPQLKSDIGVGMYAVLNEAGIEIPFPQTDLHVRNVPANSVLSGETQQRFRHPGEGFDKV